jgi:hypothetical protein
MLRDALDRTDRNLVGYALLPEKPPLLLLGPAGLKDLGPKTLLETSSSKVARKKPGTTEGTDRRCIFHSPIGRAADPPLPDRAPSTSTDQLTATVQQGWAFWGSTIAVVSGQAKPIRPIATLHSERR